MPVVSCAKTSLPRSLDVPVSLSRSVAETATDMTMMCFVTPGVAFPPGNDRVQFFSTFEAVQGAVPENSEAIFAAQAFFNRSDRPQTMCIGRVFTNPTNGTLVSGPITLSNLASVQNGGFTISVGDASGMFPIDSETKTYHAGMMEKFDALVAGDGYSWRLGEILPEVLVAGQQAGALTEEGARLLDPTGKLEAGVIMCPPEGDAGTGMVATNSVAAHTGNVSAGTSVFAMIVLDKELSKVYPEIDMVTTPAGKPAAMVHCNNCTSDLDAWVSLFREVSELLGGDTKMPKVYDALYYKALEGDPDCGGLISYNYVSGEPITGFDKGCPMFVRTPDSRMTLANFFRAQLFSTMASLRIGMNILTEQEKVRLDVLMGHGGLFKTKGVGQRLMAGAMNIPVAVMETAGEGGAWGVALLAAYLVEQKGESLEDYLNNKVFAGNSGERMAPDARDVEGFAGFMDRYQKGLAAQRGAVDNLL